MQTEMTLDYHIEPDQQGLYLYLRFTMPANVESLALRYSYPRHLESDAGGGFTARQEINIVDLGLIAPNGDQVGVSGSDKNEIMVSEETATPGYSPTALVPGEWKILVGAYKIAQQGVTVKYELVFTHKQRRLLKGDLHAHTLASDGVLTAEELGRLALRNGLDFVAVTDHNQPVRKTALPQIPGLTMIPGLEWTHYQGHANFLGIDYPFDGSYAVNSLAQILTRFSAARQRGALIIINHPFDEICAFQLDWRLLPFDCLEIWNGPMRESNLRAVGLWQSLLVAGRKVPICGGSDYHRNTPFIFLGGPTTCVFSQSPGASDILHALRRGNAYITFAPNGPWLEFTAGDAIMGDTVRWPEISQASIRAGGLLPGDVVRVVTAAGSHVIAQAPAAGQVDSVFVMESAGFARVEILRSFLPGIPMLPALISNPIYFEAPKPDERP